MPPPLRENTAAGLVQIIRDSNEPVSFSEILIKANVQGLLSWHRTLRRYLDLLVQGHVIEMREKEVGSVNRQQLYNIRQNKPQLWTGLEALALHGLNWDTPTSDLYPVTSDMAALVRSRQSQDPRDAKRITGLEDSLAFEIRRDAAETSGGIILVAALLATRPVDLAYLLRRSDTLGIGWATRTLVQKIIETFADIPAEVDGRVFLKARTRFLQLRKTYTTRRSLGLLDTPGRGRRGISLVERINPAEIVAAAGRQLGLTG